MSVLPPRRVTARILVVLTLSLAARVAPAQELTSVPTDVEIRATVPAELMPPDSARSVPKPPTLAEDEPAATNEASPSTESEAAAEPREPRDELDVLVDRAIDVTRKRLLSTRLHTPWQMAHGVLALRWDYVIQHGGEPVSALTWIADGPRFKGKPWWLKTRFGGKGHPFTEPYHFEGHPNQFLAFFATAGLPEDFEIRTGQPGEVITIADMVRNAKKTVNDREEITWTLWALSTYLEPDAVWVDQYNRGWSIERLVRMQIAKPPTKAACGGTHGLFAIANALNAYEETGQPLRGVWLEAEAHLKRYVALARRMQNRDGSFSSNYFKGPQHSKDFDKRISTSGHTLEFLMNALSDEQLGQSWVRRGVRRVATDLIEHRKDELEPGGMYHATDALVIYRERTRPEYRERRQELARQWRRLTGRTAAEEKATTVR